MKSFKKSFKMSVFKDSGKEKANRQNKKLTNKETDRREEGFKTSKNQNSLKNNPTNS